MAELLLSIITLEPFVTSELNTDAIQIGETLIPGASFYDALSAVGFRFNIYGPFRYRATLFSERPDGEVRDFFARLLLVDLFIQSQCLLRFA